MVALADEPPVVEEDCEGVFITLVGITLTVEGVEGERTWVAVAGGDEGAKDMLGRSGRVQGRVNKRCISTFVVLKECGEDLYLHLNRFASHIL